jgi:hypothetical protein
MIFLCAGSEGASSFVRDAIEHVIDQISERSILKAPASLIIATFDEEMDPLPPRALYDNPRLNNRIR